MIRYRSKRSMGRMQISLFLGLVFFSFIYLYTAPSDLDELEEEIRGLVEDTEKGKLIIDDLERSLTNVDNVAIHANVSYVVFNRVPKCGSMFLTTLCYKLGTRNKFKVESPYEAGEKPQKTATQQQKFVNELYQLPAPNLYIRHQWFINFEEWKSRNPIYINMIRDPIARFESFYYFSRFGNNKGGGGQAQLSGEQKNESVDECVRNKRKECLMPYWQIVPYFCGQDSRCALRSQWATNKAIENIEKYYLFVGTLEDLDASLETLGMLLPELFAGAKELTDLSASKDMRHDTLTKNKRETSEETKLFLKAETSLRYEYQLYDYVRHRLDATKAKFGVK